MKHVLRVSALISALALPQLASAEGAIALTLADPQPEAGSLTPGLAVKYTSSKFNGKTLEEAEEALEDAADGPALVGFSYDTEEAENVLTSDLATKVAADISGYIKFDAAGTYVLDFLSNDGLVIEIGGKELGVYDGIHPCGYVGEQTVEIPAAGYYALDATYFQRKGSACLLMEWGPDSDGLEAVPDTAFFH